MSHPTDVRPIGVRVYALPVKTRVPLKFGTETLTSVICIRVRMTVCDHTGKTAEGWGETPLSVQWVWPSEQSYDARHRVLMELCENMARAWTEFDETGHPLEVGHAFQEKQLPQLLEQINRTAEVGPVPYLASLVCCSAFDIALHDAFGQLVAKPLYETYNQHFMNHDLSAFLEPAEDSDINFANRWPADYFVSPKTHLPVWHLVGGLDPIDANDLTGNEPDDGYPVLLQDWIKRDGLKCLKIKLRGSDIEWDFKRLVRIGLVAIDTGVDWLTTDFNCTVTDPVYVNDILDRLCNEHPRIYSMILYVEQPFPYELETHRIDVHSVSARKPLFMDESAHDWRMVRLGRTLGWTGVVLKTCKTQTGAILTLCWAKAHGMTLMVQDLTNPMLAQIPHVLLAAHAGTIMGVESNAMQFYPEASNPEAKVHPGLYQRHCGTLDLSSIKGPGFGYRQDEINRMLPSVLDL